MLTSRQHYVLLPTRLNSQYYKKPYLNKNIGRHRLCRVIQTDLNLNLYVIYIVKTKTGIGQTLYSAQVLKATAISIKYF